MESLRTLHEGWFVSSGPLLALLLALHVHVVTAGCSVVGVLQRLRHLPRHLDLLLDRRVFVLRIVVKRRVGVDLCKHRQENKAMKMPLKD